MEILVAVGICVIIAAVLIPNFGKISRSVSKARCLSNMRSLHTAFSSYVQDKGYWPQQPDFSVGQDSQYEDWWLNTMRPYTDSDKIWQCPVLAKANIVGPSKKPMRIHYVPTMFDANRITPFLWPTQPWLIEAGDAHGTGALILFPDGSIKSLHEILINK